MVTSHARQIQSRENRGAALRARQAEGGLRASVLERLHRLFCGVHGHDSLLQFEQDRLFLKCSTCGHESPGWALAKTRPPARLRGDAQRHALVRPRLVDARRTA
jgi:hypothetical protein